MTSSWMLRRVALVRTGVSEERSASIIRVTRIGELGMLAVTNNQCTLRRSIKQFLRSLRRVLVTANVVPTSQILVTMMTEALHSPQRSRVRFPALPDFLSSSGSGTGPTQPL
jgi:hypothetical protein